MRFREQPSIIASCFAVPLRLSAFARRYLILLFSLRLSAFARESLPAENLPELFDGRVVLLYRIPQRDCQLELRLIQFGRERFDVRARGNSPQCAQALLRRLRQKKIDK